MEKHACARNDERRNIEFVHSRSRVELDSRYRRVEVSVQGFRDCESCFPSDLSRNVSLGAVERPERSREGTWAGFSGFLARRGPPKRVRELKRRNAIRSVEHRAGDGDGVLRGTVLDKNQILSPRKGRACSVKQKRTFSESSDQRARLSKATHGSKWRPILPTVSHIFR